MKKGGILIGGLIFAFVFEAVAQTDMNSVFSSDNKNILYSNQAKDYTGSPLVFIEGISDVPQPKDWKDELKIKLFGSMEIPQKESQKPLPPLAQSNVQNSLKIVPTFGEEKEVAFVPHTSDWNFIIQILNDEDILIQEDIQFIKTADVLAPVRDWPKQNLTVIEAQINGQKIPLNLEEYQDTLRLNLPELETGVYKIRLNYLIQNAGVFGKKNAFIELPLTGMGWNLPTNTLNGIVLFPTKINMVKAEFLLGKNHQEIQGAFETQQDNQGALFFKATHLMPAQSVLQLNLDLAFDSFVKKGFWEKRAGSAPFLIFIVALGVILLYLILNIIEIKITPVEEVWLKKKYKVSENSFKNFMWRTGEIWIGLILLWGCAFLCLYFTNTALSIPEIQVLFLLPIVFVLITDYLLLYPRQETLKKIRREND
ncbi:MAG: hypothetical protein ACI4OR_04495 [Alphaproteobacteria bacterium]